ncbi:hypothetical protein [Epilithonimonas hispanica]|uniref:Uncharacterized protein n=1 Tax=Epilithonimonas hispanica TaxID=358687 RepID=A0A3D9CSC7_9FLAO|nr:hypothetical protein [Epilithonimonas hispanica]REC68601.1 hypothetical protein DRF58_13775 [Epilithonimonas hispanica]
MDAIRQFVDVKDNSFQITLPEDFKAKRVEVIILPSDDQFQISKETQNLLNERKADYLKNPENATDFDQFIDDLENDL